jgi:uroporphyrinogen decarboxylase
VTDPLFLRACRREPTPRPPVWLMRQAGRYLPQYRALRERADFLTLVTDPALATEVTLQPVEHLGVDAAILFCDILVVPWAMGMALRFDEGVGPLFEQPLRTERDIAGLRAPDLAGELGYVFEAIRLTRRALDPAVPLIGFAGAPWTLASYMIEGRGSKDWRKAKRLLAERPDLAHDLLGRLADLVGAYLVAQVEAGAQAVQLFDSWATALGPEDYRAFGLPYLARAATIARSAGAPVIVFAPGAEYALADLARESAADVIGIHWRMDPREARRRLAGAPVALQGNLEPAWLYAAPGEIRRRSHAMVDAIGRQAYIANLGHGVLRDTPVDHVRSFVDAIRGLE